MAKLIIDSKKFYMGIQFPVEKDIEGLNFKSPIFWGFEELEEIEEIEDN